MRPATALTLGATALLSACTDPVEPLVRRGQAIATVASVSPTEISHLSCNSWNNYGEIFCGVMVSYADGKTRPLAFGHIGSGVTWSPDGARLAFGGMDGDVLMMTIADGRIVHLTDHPAWDKNPAWSPDGRRIVFVSNRDGGPELYLMNADGSNVTRLTYATGFNEWGHASWSPDGSRIAFTCDYVICAINTDGTGLVRLTPGIWPDWSPDGARIAFMCAGAICVMKADGSGLTQLTSDVHNAGGPDWSPDGTRIAFGGDPLVCDGNLVCEYTAYVMSADGSAPQALAISSGPLWVPAPPPPPPVNPPPFASFWYQCSPPSCTFYPRPSFDNGVSYDVDEIVSWNWDFGDGFSSTEGQPTHTYAAPGTFQVTLTVADGSGLTDSRTMSVIPIPPPVVEFTAFCTQQLTCTFASQSSTAVAWLWDFGDGQTSTSANPSHTYPTVGSYDVTLTVTGAYGSTASATKSIIVVTPIVLSASGLRDHGLTAVDLSWRGASGTDVDVFRNNTALVTTPNDGAYRDQLGRGAKGTFTYRVCNAGTTTCSLPVTITF